MTNDRSDEEAVVCNFSTHRHTGSTEIQVHLVVGTGDGGQGKVAHAVELQLKGQRWFQVTVDPVLLKLQKQEQDTVNVKVIMKPVNDLFKVSFASCVSAVIDSRDARELWWLLSK